VDETFDEDIDTLFKELTGFIEDNSVVLTHDLIFLPDYTKLHVAARRMANERPSISWVHTIHSATAPRGLIEEREMYGETYKELLMSKFPNSVIAYPNSYDIPRVARNFSFEEDEIHEVPHASDSSEGMERIVRDVYFNHKLYEPEVLMVFPLRLDRGKNAEMNVQLAAALKRLGTTVKMLFCDFQSTGDDKVVYREDLKRLAKYLDVEEEVLFLSELDDSAQLEVSHNAVLDFLTLSNVFMMPSKSETYSLVVQEAMMKGNFCILNHDFAPMRQIYGDNAIYRQFSSNIGFDGMNGEINTNYSPNIEAYFDDLARAVKYYVSRDKTVKAKTWVRTKRNYSYVFKNYLEPLLGDLREAA
jgi:glycosyltransferase involved in cell wall biosynthesis